MTIFTVLAAAQAALLVVMGVKLGRSLAKFRIEKTYVAASNAPSVSVCIPARNETHAMTQCLERVLASDYEKLEIIVFDDSSTDDTSILIRSFASAGVRFVPGAPLPEGWLGKPHALEVLAREASGMYIVFMDVDTQVTPTTVSQLIGYIMTKNTDMLSVIPGRYDGWRASVLFGHLRYFWELLLSRPHSPATSSALWAIKRSTLLDKFGGFAPFKASVAPEMLLARLLGEGAYRCLLANAALGVTYEKKWHSQAETAQRLLYPRVGGTWWQGLFALSMLVFLNLPFAGALSSIWLGWGILQLIALGLLGGFMAVYGVYTYHLWRRGWWAGGLLWPVVVLQELLLFLWSVWGYARRTITWKGRLVTNSGATSKLEG